MTKFTKDELVINHKILNRKMYMQTDELTKFYAWYENLPPEKKVFYKNGFTRILAPAIGRGGILVLIIGFILGHYIV
ncbi:MAG: hypothetical protein WC929_08980 [Bacilli bacterium]|jgi:hypothetical protein